MSGGQVRVTHDLDGSMVGRHVLVVEDILDTGLTLSVLLQQLQAREPTSLKLCVLPNRHITRQYEITPDDVGFDLPDGFMMGVRNRLCGGLPQASRHLRPHHANAPCVTFRRLDGVAPVIPHADAHPLTPPAWRHRPVPQKRTR